MNLSIKQTHRHTEQTCGCQGGGVIGEQRIGSLGLTNATLYILLHSKGDYIQSPVINHNGKEYKK